MVPVCTYTFLSAKKEAQPFDRAPDTLAGGTSDVCHYLLLEPSIRAVKMEGSFPSNGGIACESHFLSI